MTTNIHRRVKPASGTANINASQSQSESWLEQGFKEPGRIMRSDEFERHSIGLFPATYALVIDALNQDKTIHWSPSLFNDASIGLLSARNTIRSSNRMGNANSGNANLSNADVLICNETDRPDLMTLNNHDRSKPVMLILQCRSFYRGIIYRTVTADIKKQRKVRCSGFNGSLLHERNKLIEQGQSLCDLVLVCGKEFFCIPASTRLIVNDKTR